MDHYQNTGKHAHRHWSGIAAGVIIIALGVFFLFYNFGVRLPFMATHNWWAFFILIGAIGPLGQAIAYYRSHGKIDSSVLHSLTSVAAIVTVALMFLLELRWDHWWPLFLIYGGLWTIFRRTGALAHGENGNRRGNP